MWQNSRLKQFETFTFLLILLLNIFEIHSKSNALAHDISRNFITKDANFISTLAMQEYFSQCKILFVHDNPHQNILSKFSRAQLQLLYQMTKPQIDFGGKGYLKNFYIHNIQVDSPNFNPNRYTGVHRFSHHCLLTVLSIQSAGKVQILDKLLKLSTRPFGTFLWKDTDHFIFHSPPQLTESLLLSEASLKIKFKLAVSSIVENGAKIQNLAVKTSCFYCEGGKPSIVTLQPSPFSGYENWDEKQRLPSLPHLFPDHVTNFHGWEIRAAVSSKIVYRIEIYRNEGGGWSGKPGVHTRMIEMMSGKFNFTYKFFPSIGGGGSGVKWPNGTWTGSMADIIYNNADLGMVTAQTLDRNELVSFSFPITYDWLTFATGLAKPFHNWTAIYRPFSSIFWLCILISILSIILVLYGAGQFQMTQDKLTLDYTIWHVMSSLLDQTFMNPKAVTLKILCASWTLFILNVSTAYRSELVSSLAFPLVGKLPETFVELTQSPEYKWGLYYLAGAAYSAFRSSTNPTYMKIFRGMDIQHSAVKCLLRASESNYGCIIYQGSAIDIGYRNLSDRYGRVPIVVAPATTFFISSCWVMEKRVIFRPNFERIMHFAVDIGLNAKWVELNYERIKNERPKEAKDFTYKFSKDSGPEPLMFSHFSGIFWTLIFGLSVSIIVCLIEKNWTKFFKRGYSKVRKIFKSNDKNKLFPDGALVLVNLSKWRREGYNDPDHKV